MHSDVFVRSLQLLLVIASALLIAGAAKAEDAPSPPVKRQHVIIPDVPQNREPVKSTVYVIDATGTTTSAWEDIIALLHASISDLVSPQRFNIVLTNTRHPEPLGRELLPATAANKMKSDDYLAKQTPGGGTDPLPDLKKAFSLKPESIFLLLDPTCFPDQKALVELVGKDENKKVRLDIIAFEGHDAELEKFLKSIATKSGGFYKYMSERELSAQKK